MKKDFSNGFLYVPHCEKKTRLFLYSVVSSSFVSFATNSLFPSLFVGRTGGREPGRLGAGGGRGKDGKWEF